MVVVGIVGILLPLIPTTAPLLLAAGLFARSSPRLERWLLSSRLLGPYIRNYREGRGMTRRHKIWTIAMLWIGIGVSAWFSRSAVVALVVLALVLFGVTIHILAIRTATPEADVEKSNGGSATPGSDIPHTRSDALAPD
jgi:uncharacterized membrane protein YbaN (DUF454 family)